MSDSVVVGLPIMSHSMIPKRLPVVVTINRLLKAGVPKI